MPDARHLTRRLFLGGGLKATLAAGLGAGLSLGELLARGRAPGGTRPPRAHRYDGELIEESYSVAHRLRDGSLEIPVALAPEGPLHDAIVIGGGVARKDHANGTDYTCATWSVVRPKDAFLLRLFQDLGVVQGLAADGTPRI